MICRFGQKRHKKRPISCEIDLKAEEEGFEPPVPLGTTVFKTAAIDHSATPLVYFLIEIAKVHAFIFLDKLFFRFYPKSLILF